MNQHKASNDSPPEPRQRQGAVAKDPIAARKVQKADREKLRRDRLNEQFIELGQTLDPDRPKNDKATILTDTVQVLKDLTSEVNRLKAECSALTEESRELLQEKNELREEKASLKSDVEALNMQYQQRLRAMFPWGPVDPSVIMGSPYSYAVPVPVPPGSIPMHPPMQPFPFYRNQPPSNPVHGTCPTFISFPTPPNPPNEQPSAQSASTSHGSSKPDPRSKLVCHPGDSHIEECCDDSGEVATELVLKMPGSSSQQAAVERKGKQRKEKENCVVSSSISSSPHVAHDYSSNSIGDAASSKP
ncbi:unnamed protein product [Linum tenue]|uniref:BHLH domain-containing protein n=1 Tax=Linum tenue TaxID=586396 RepID=A0AAV0I7B6_9ROSI|nr:unnamed protein product [Linum tenue]